MTSTDASTTVVDPRFALLKEDGLLLDLLLFPSILVGVISPLSAMPLSFPRFESSRPAPRPPSSTMLSRNSSQLIQIGEPWCNMSTPRSATLRPCSISVIDTILSGLSPGSCIALTSMLRSLPIASFAKITVLRDDSTRTGTGRYCRAVSAAAVVVGVDVIPTERASLRFEAGDGGPSGRISK
jgi:hypothetical protein